MDTRPENSPYQIQALQLPETLAWQVIRNHFETGNFAFNMPNLNSFNATPMALSTHKDSVFEIIPPETWPPTQPLNLYWFRWALSHHIIFLSWHKMTCLILQHLQSPLKTEHIEAISLTCAYLTKLCSLMLLYAASCPNGLYKKYIRTFMALYHKGFTAKWSLDYNAHKIAVDTFLQQHFKDPSVLSFQGAYAEYKVVHLAVAKKFMKNAPSLLKTQSHSQPDLGTLTKEKQFLYDAFFLVQRTATSEVKLEEFFAGKILQMKLDLYTNPFFPDHRIPKLFQMQKKITALLQESEKIIHRAQLAFTQSHT